MAEPNKESAAKSDTPRAETAAAGGDAEKYKVHAVVSYLWILWLVPLLAAKESKFAMFHANQGLVLFLVSLVLSFVSGFIPILGPILGLFVLAPIVAIGTVILMIIGIINAVQGKMTPLPLIGGIQILK